MKKLGKILLIDDDAVANFVNEQLIKKMDLAYDVRISLNGEEAMSEINNHTYPELIFLDINMPVSNGFEFLKNLKILKLVQSEMVIVILTNEVKPGDLEQLVYFGINEVINKPLTKEKVTSVFGKYFVK